LTSSIILHFRIEKATSFDVIFFSRISHATPALPFSETYLFLLFEPAILGGVNCYRANTSFKDWKGIIIVPILVIHGMKDKAVLSSVLDELSNYVSDMKIIRAENTSHWVMHDVPELIISSFKEFF